MSGLRPRYRQGHAEKEVPNEAASAAKERGFHERLLLKRWRRRWPKDRIQPRERVKVPESMRIYWMRSRHPAESRRRRGRVLDRDAGVADTERDHLFQFRSAGQDVE